MSAHLRLAPRPTLHLWHGSRACTYRRLMSRARILYTLPSRERWSSAAVVSLLAYLTAAAACAHEAGAHTQPQPAADAPKPDAVQTTAATVPETRTPAPNDASSATATDAERMPTRAPVDIAAFMRDHFIITAWARDAVAEGDLESLREPLRELAAYRYPGVVPGAWMQYLARLQAAAKLTSEAQQLPAAAAGVATMARLCGECHVQHRVELSVSFRTPSERPEPETESLSTRMYRHQWASTRLWEGLTAPSDEAWAAGAAALAEIPASISPSGQALGPDTLAMLKQVQQIGTEASNANTLDERATSYGRLLSLCSQCHAARSTAPH